MVVRRTIPVRLDDDLIRRADAVAEALTRRAAGISISRSEALRTAIERGLADLEREVGLKRRSKKR